MARETFALIEGDLRERIRSLEADAIAYREVAQQGIHVLARLTAERDRLRRTCASQADQIRALLRVLREQAASGQPRVA